MEIIFLILPLTAFLALLGLFAYFWCVRHGQFDDLETPSVRLLNSDDDD